MDAAHVPDDPSVPPVTHAHLSGRLRELEENLQATFYNPTEQPVRRSKGNLLRMSNSTRVNSRLGHAGGGASSSPKK